MIELLADPGVIPILDGASVSSVRERVRAVGGELGLEREVIESVATAASELARNQLDHGHHGRFVVRVIERGGVRGIELVAADRGPGLVDPRRVLEGAVSTSGSLGSGLASVRRFMDELDFDIRIGQGTCIWARRFDGVASYRSEVGILGRPCHGECESGDDAAFVRRDDALIIGVVDGLGHGLLARAAAAAAAVVIFERPELDPVALLAAADTALVGTRGAVMAVARVERARSQIEHAGIGDIRTHIYRPRECQRLAQVAGVLGAATPRDPRKLVAERLHIDENDVIVMFSDGLTTRVDISNELQLLRAHPIIIAAHLLEQFGRSNDDAIVLVVR